MPRVATGSVYWSRGQAFARLTLDERVHVKLPTCTTQEQAEERKRILADMAMELREAGHGGEIGSSCFAGLPRQRTASLWRRCARPCGASSLATTAYRRLP